MANVVNVWHKSRSVVRSLLTYSNVRGAPEERHKPLEVKGGWCLQGTLPGSPPLELFFICILQKKWLPISGFSFSKIGITKLKETKIKKKQHKQSPKLRIVSPSLCPCFHSCVFFFSRQLEVWSFLSYSPRALSSIKYSRLLSYTETAKKESQSM